MKFYLKIFILAVVCFSLMIFSGIYAFNKFYVDNSEDQPVVIDNGKDTTIEDDTKNDKEIEESEKSKLDKLIEESDRINVLLFGVEGPRADTIILASYDPDKNIVDLISVPRDTYNPVEGYDAPGQHKINATYGFKDIGGSKGMKRIVSEFLDVPIDYYVKVNYNGVAAIIDVLGGIKVDVPFDMNYDDIYAEPELHIHFEAGEQVLNGDDSVKYLRWRKNNGEEGRGDIYRIKRQQEFILKAVDKALSLKLPVVVKTAINYVKTDMPVQKALYYAVKASDISIENINKYQIPGEPGKNGNGYYIHDPQKMEEMFIEIYSK